MSPKNLTISEFGKIYGPKVTKTYELLRGGHLKGIKIGKSTYIPTEEAEKWAQNLPAYKSGV